jgi:hypothetical protein
LTRKTETLCKFIGYAGNARRVWMSVSFKRIRLACDSQHHILKRPLFIIRSKQNRRHRKNDL